jgi:membrane protein implicated in regulation of membrane protease activity
MLMLRRILTLLSALVALLLLAACGGSRNAPTPTNAPAPTPNAETTAQASAPGGVAYQGADWTRLPLTDARTGQTFTLADFAGKTVFVHPMARW